MLPEHNLNSLVRLRLLNCRTYRRALESWLSFLRPLRWITVIGSISLSAIAGASFLTASTFGPRAPLVASICAVTASILGLLHTALKCDEYQVKCEHLIGEFAALEAAVEASQHVPADFKPMKILETRYEDLIRQSTAIAPPSFLQRAQKKISQA